MKRFVLLDGHAILHRAYHALPPLTTKDGTPVGAVFGFTSMLLKVVSSFPPSFLAVAFDLPEPTFRKTLFSGYQALRAKMDDALSCQIPLVSELLGAFRIPIFSSRGYEADDVIGTIAHLVTAQHDGKGEHTTVIIVTGDRDMLQLVSPRVTVFLPRKGLSGGSLYDASLVYDTWGVSPRQIVDYKALVGDASDNYPGVAGIGPKTARDLLRRFHTLDGIYAHVTDVKSERVRTLLVEKRNFAFLSRRLAEIVTTVPIAFSPEACTAFSFDTPDARRRLEAFGFHSLLKRISGSHTVSFAHVQQRAEDGQMSFSV